LSMSFSTSCSASMKRWREWSKISSMTVFSRGR
jgi:hypothetical protein